jgi:hypothetical protein
VISQAKNVRSEILQMVSTSQLRAIRTRNATSEIECQLHILVMMGVCSTLQPTAGTHAPTHRPAS